MVNERLTGEASDDRRASRAWLLLRSDALSAADDLPAAGVLVVDLSESAHARDAIARARGLGPPRPVFAGVRGVRGTALDPLLDALLPALPDGIVLWDCIGAGDVQRLGAKLAVREAEARLVHGSTTIVAVAGGSAAGLLASGTLPGASARLRAVAWDAAALSADLARDGRPVPAPALAHARTLTLVAARAAGIEALDTASDARGAAFDAECAAAVRDGFDGKLARDPAQAAAIEAAYRA